ncbi:MAG: PQ-loop domain-containing transporter, partial [Dehalococcoidia bacterium]
MSIHWFGYVGTALVIVAYLPQITHLIREKCSA